jgi:gamma-glutamyl:cysteine ligase YbdK (ATP-grasp superfamily)
MNDERWGLFERWGVEVEYMIVDAETLEVSPIADRLLTDADGQPVAEIEVGPLAWSNELVLHVLELKTNGPAESLHGLAASFQEGIADANRRLSQYGGMLMPTGMHPRMDPVRQTKLWPHDNSVVYETFDRIFGCSGHGWANLQSVHLNLPVRDDDEFRRLHAAIRVVLPLLPALAASSPFMDGRITAWLDTRIEVYRHNADRIPSVSGLVVPEPASSEREYHETILKPIWTDLEPHDPEGVLREEWVNARGAIARFDRGTIEIRVLDTQECAVADVAVVAAASALIRRLADETTASVETLNALPTDQLASLLLDTATMGDRTEIDDRAYLEAIGWTTGACRARDFWDRAIEGGLDDGPDREQWERALEVILGDGCLARRILARTGDSPDRRAIDATYRALTSCLASGRQLRTRAANE